MRKEFTGDSDSRIGNDHLQNDLVIFDTDLPEFGCNGSSCIRIFDRIAVKIQKNLTNVYRRTADIRMLECHDTGIVIYHGNALFFSLHPDDRLNII